MEYKQTTPMQWITLYYMGNDEEKMKRTREENLQMRKYVRYANVADEIEEEGLETLSDTNNHYVGMTDSGIIVTFENNN